MRFSNKNLLRTFVLKKNEFRKILMTNLGLTSIDVDKFLDIKKTALNLPTYRIMNNCLICQKYNVNVDSLEKLHYCLKLHDYTLEHRIKVLKEIGVPVIKLSLVNNILYHFHKTVSKFKEKANIPAEQNIAANIFGGEIPENLIHLKKLNDNLTVLEYYQTCLLHCKNRIFNVPYLDDKILLQKHLKIKSISMVAETLKVLRNDLKYDDEMIKKNSSVIVASPDNIRTLLNSFTEILGMPIVPFLKKYPYILLQDAGNTKRLLMSFKQYEIPDKYVKNYMKIFLISNEAFHERIELIKRHPNLNMWYKHRRMLQIICQIKKIKYRMEYVDIMDSLKWLNPQSLLASKPEVEKSVQTGIVSAKHNIKHILMKELGMDLSDLLMRHQHWKTVAFVDIVKMLKYLKKHFKINEICPNIHIILYDQLKVEKLLADLKKQHSQSTKYSFTNSQYLALCLYMLEKDNYFTGDGIWSNEQNAMQQSSEERNIAEKSYNNMNILKDTNDYLNLENSINIDVDNFKDVTFSNNIQNRNS
ncbi:transcription termination factor 5, mitochondrial [Solenopsis invicta]|uniref:transcription termination factor 5, mitochondrial n=1 Tax=Solenopsis invicta TaxID=13686 RepID=UPI0005961702|nr:transcription termination factor 5, mitochondrial [Solenopsis invicta]